MTRRADKMDAENPEPGNAGNAALNVLRATTGPGPTKATPATIERLISVLAIGGTIAEACRYARISERTFRQWRADYSAWAKGREIDFAALKSKTPTELLARVPDDVPANVWPLAVLFELIEASQDVTILKAKRVLSQALDGGDVATAKWMLEKLAPGTYGHRATVTVRPEVASAEPGANLDADSVRELIAYYAENPDAKE